MVSPEGQGRSAEAGGENNGEGWGTGAKVSVVMGLLREKVAIVLCSSLCNLYKDIQILVTKESTGSTDCTV